MNDAEWTVVRVGDRASLAACLDGLPPVEAGIVRAVHDAAAGIPPEFWRCAPPRGSSSKWTNALLGAVADLATKMTPPRHAMMTGRGVEFLWDVVWAKECTQGIPGGDALALACEEEWNWKDRNATLYDFKKLTFANADLRLLIFDALAREFADDKSVFRNASPPGRNAAYLAIGIHCTTDSEAERRMIVDWWRA